MAGARLSSISREDGGGDHVLGVAIISQAIMDAFGRIGRNDGCYGNEPGLDQRAFLQADALVWLLRPNPDLEFICGLCNEGDYSADGLSRSIGQQLVEAGVLDAAQVEAIRSGKLRKLDLAALLTPAFQARDALKRARRDRRRANVDGAAASP